MKVKSLSRVRLFTNPRTAAHQALPSMGFSRQEYWRGVPLPSPVIGIDLQEKKKKKNSFKVAGNRMTMTNGKCQVEFLL